MRAMKKIIKIKKDEKKIVKYLKKKIKKKM